MNGQDLDLLFLRLQALLGNILLKQALLLVDQLIEPVQLRSKATFLLMGILDDLTDVAVVGVQTLTIFELKQTLTLLMIRVITPLQECR